MEARSSITSTTLPAPAPYFIIEGSAEPGLLGISSECSSLQSAGRVDRKRWGWRTSAPIVKWVILRCLLFTHSSGCPWTLWMVIGMKADKHMLVYIFGQVKNRGLEKSQGLIQHGPAFSRHTLWEGRLNRLHSCTCKIQSSRNLLNSYCDRPRSPRRHQSKALACMHCTIRIDRSRGLLKTERKGAGEMGWWLRALTALEEDLASLSSTSQQIIIICKSSFQE